MTDTPATPAEPPATTSAPWPPPTAASGPAVSWPTAPEPTPLPPEDPPSAPRLVDHIFVGLGCLLAVGLGFADLHLGTQMGKDFDDGLIGAGLIGLGVRGGYGVVTAGR